MNPAATNPEQHLFTGTQDDAQQRADRIKSFTAELAQLEQEQVISLAQEQRAAIARYHGTLLEQLASRFDIDTSPTAKQMSAGMRIISFLGALALSAAVFFFFYRFWGLLTVPLQVAILITVPLAALAGVGFAARREKTLYFASLVSLVALTAFVLNLSMLGRIFSITPTQNAFLAWGAFALTIAYTYRLRLMLVAGLLSLLGYLAATIGTWSGCYWLSFGERPENFLLAGLLFCAASLLPVHRFGGFATVYRVFGLLVVLVAVLILSHWGMGSYLLLEARHIEYAYQAAGFLLSGLVIWLGIRRHWPGTSNLGSTFFVIFLYTKFFDWWWDWLPKYLFFLLLGAIALLLLFVLRRLRSLVTEVAP
jgi:uncharacterized membrane protein